MMLLKLLKAPFGMLAGKKNLERKKTLMRIVLTCQSGKNNQPGTDIGQGLPDLEKKAGSSLKIEAITAITKLTYLFFLKLFIHSASLIISYPL